LTCSGAISASRLLLLSSFDPDALERAAVDPDALLGRFELALCAMEPQ
jgi:hypothetical protein